MFWLQKQERGLRRCAEELVLGDPRVVTAGDLIMGDLGRNHAPLAVLQVLEAVIGQDRTLLLRNDEVTTLDLL